MNFKEFNFDHNIRICVYNVGRESLDFHKHNHIADITYCAKGKLAIEMLDSHTRVDLQQGEFFQVPRAQKHRCYHIATDTEMSRYVLIQIGQFDIEFIKQEAIACELKSDFVHSALSKNQCELYQNADKLQDILSWFNGKLNEVALEDSNQQEEIQDIIKGIDDVLKSTQINAALVD